jgi:hypothetical protein
MFDVLFIYTYGLCMQFLKGKCGLSIYMILCTCDDVYHLKDNMVWKETLEFHHQNER